MNKTEKHIVPELLHPIRLQEYGVGIFNSALTKSALKKAIKKELITINGALASTATFIKGGETIQISIPETTKAKKELIFPLPVLYEDEYLAVIHKPAGILVSGNSFKTIANALPQNLKKSTLIDAAIPQPVHRLDYPTTGILLTGKTSNSIRILNKLFEDKKIQKTYFAITIGKMDSKGVITATIDGKKSKSKYKVLKTVPSKRFGNLNLVKLKPKTGRKHQLRIHLASIGNPILGDKEYGKEGLILNGKGLYLHAYSLEFTHPFTQQKLCLKNELPERFRKVIG
ncbi:RluA family pseudouridine synthase [Joostella sp.]|uniref:RluA family pseudouridine synthase n=1 Tax=Joostella sp. TaxID=2231138 RepID=UPI003A94688D